MEHILYFYKKLSTFAGKKLYVNLLAMMIISLLDGIGIIMLIPLITSSGLISMDFGNLSSASFIFEYLNRIVETLSFTSILIIFVVVGILQNLIHRYLTIQNTKIQHGFFRKLRIETYSALLYSNWNFFLKKRKSDIINSLTAEIAQASAGTNTFLQFITAIIFTTIQVIVAFILSPKITLFVLLSGFLLTLCSYSFIKKSRALGKLNWQFGQSYLAGITDSFNGIKEIKSNNLEESRINWYSSMTKQLHDEQINYSKLKSLSQFNYKVASIILIAVFIYFSVTFFNTEVAQLLLIVAIFSRLWPRITGIQAGLEQMATITPALKAVIKLQQDCLEAKEIVEDIEQEPLKIAIGIECKNVFFKYSEGDQKYALKGIDIYIPSYQMTAVVGRSGAGKSTLIDLLMGLNQHESGKVLIDGQPLSSSNVMALRKSISYVPQDPFLFNVSIRDNLLIINQNASEQQIWEALEFSSAAEFVRKLPNGLDTLIGDRGIRLSGGERQRIVLARAILRNPSILVLDEATSALDTENESKIQEAIERLKGKMTIIVIAHRLSTIRNADQVIVLDQGEVIQQGGFHQLAKDKRGMFSHLLGKQMGASL
ncbi:ABC transporter ATP-binding protein [Fredinandcohnia sp. 179-A 10B2 NHS]|uniref:ABC transporter ATP-binding protein n=1 Tax=Fredinandcohnia sp. 179-A 10B2 NHS TaxID=3235176 RepID=UPI0039A2AFC4